MKRIAVTSILLAALLAGTARPAAAQGRAADPSLVQVATPPSAAAQAGSPEGAVVQAPSQWRAMRVAKWTTAGVAVGAALYGFASNQRADDAYEQLEAMCQADRQRCASRGADGSYNDGTLESEYQRVRRLDRRARAGLLVGQAAVAASVALFILDLRNDRPPPNIPFEPRGRLQLSPAPDGGLEVGVRWRR